MELVHARCAGLDVSKRDAKVCANRRQGPRGHEGDGDQVGRTTNQVLALREYLLDQDVTLVVMEATGDYWKPFYYLREGGLDVMLVNAQHAKNLPGRKTDVPDGAWLVQLGAHGLVRGSFVPPAPIRQLRDLTRARTSITRERAREIQRLEKLLEDAGIRLSSVASDITGVSGRAMLEALIAGQRDPSMLADLAKRRLRNKIPELTEAMVGRFGEHHAFLVRTHLDLIDQHTKAIENITARIAEVMAPFRRAWDLLTSIPGIGTLVADVIVAETGGDMTPFSSPGRLASWAGTCPGSNESAGRVKPTPDPPRQPVPQRRARHRRDARSGQQEHLPRGEIPAHRRPLRTGQSHRRRRTRHAHRSLVHDHRRPRIHRPRRRLLHPPRPRPRPPPRHRPTPRHRLRRHPHTPSGATTTRSQLTKSAYQKGGTCDIDCQANAGGWCQVGPTDS